MATANSMRIPRSANQIRRTWLSRLLWKLYICYIYSVMERMSCFLSNGPIANIAVDCLVDFMNSHTTHNAAMCQCCTVIMISAVWCNAIARYILRGFEVGAYVNDGFDTSHTFDYMEQDKKYTLSLACL